ncbi:hypothetical protein LOB22_09765, partial [Lactobacillus delbrueckii subsp. lactis]|nr:hypothetical protein [Lactobacillus delbrueckii subsp. lactis]
FIKNLLILAIMAAAVVNYHEQIQTFLLEAAGTASTYLEQKGLMLISQDFTTQAIRLTDFLPAVFLLCMTFQKCEDLSFSSGTF